MAPVLAWIKVHRLIVAGMLVVVLVSWNVGGSDDPKELTDGSVQPRVTAPSDEPEEPDRAEHPEKPKASETPTAKPKPRVRRYRVLDVVDGDTVKVGYRGGESVRVIGIDTPETVHPSESVECWGPRASAAATKLLSGRRVGLVFDPTQGRRDAFGRLLAYVTISGVGDFGIVMIRRGHAVEYTYDTAYANQGRYQRAEAKARNADRGLWGKCGGAARPLNPPAEKPGPKPATVAGGSCAAGYDPCLPPYPPDVDCADVDGPIRVTGEDPHGLDRDGDGVACE